MKERDSERERKREREREIRPAKQRYIRRVKESGRDRHTDRERK